MANDPIRKLGYLRESYHYFHLRDTAGQERDFHFHEFDKLVILLSGKVKYAVESNEYLLRPRDILLVRHHTIHRAGIDKSEPYERIIIYIDRSYFERAMPGARLMESFDAADEGSRYLLKPTDEQWQSVDSLLRELESMANDDRYGAQTLRETVMVRLLVEISRIAPRRFTGTENEIDDPKIRDTLSYINENFRQELSVEHLAERVYLSRYHFMRLFKAQTGTTVHSYVRQKRLLYAARLMREGMSASLAAAESGFSDYSAFHRAFRDSFGITPGSILR